MDFSKHGRSTLGDIYFSDGWLEKCGLWNLLNGPCVTEHNSGYFILSIFGSPNAKTTPAHPFEAIQMYPGSLQEKQLLLGTAVGISIKKSSGAYLNFFLNPSWS